MSSLLILLWISASSAIKDCTTVSHVFLRNTTRGVEVGVASPHAPFNSTLIDGVYLPPECSPASPGHRSPCNLTSILSKPSPSDSLSLTAYVPANSSLLVLKFTGSSTGQEYNLTDVTVVMTPGGCNPLTIGRSVDPEELDVLCVKGSDVTSLTLDLSSGKPVFKVLDSMRVSGPLYTSFFTASNANCPSVGTIANTVVFLDSFRAVIAAFTTTAPSLFTERNFDFLSSACPGVGQLESYGNAFLLRCSTTSAFTFDPCHQSQHVTNHSLSVPYPCSASGVVAWMYPANNSIVVRFENGTVTQPIVLGSVSEASCVNAKDPQFVYRHANGSVYVVRIQDGRVTTLGTSVCSMPLTSPALCSRLDFTEHEGSFFVGFFDRLTYKMANLSCPGEAPAVVGVAFRPDLSTSFVGPDERRCLCSSQAPTLPPTMTEPLSLSQSPWSPSQSASSFPTTTPPPSHNQTQTQAMLPSIYGLIIVVSLMFLIICCVAVILVVHVRRKYYGKNKSKLCVQQEDSLSAGKTSAIAQPCSSLHSSSSVNNEDLEQGLATSESASTGSDVSPKPEVETGFEPNKSQLHMAGSKSITRSWLPVQPVQNSLHEEPTIEPVQVSSEGPHDMSLETGQCPPSIGVHDVVRQNDDCTRSEDRRNDRASKMEALGTNGAAW
eukprot:Em0020g450a